MNIKLKKDIKGKLDNMFEELMGENPNLGTHIIIDEMSKELACYSKLLQLK